MSNTIRKHSTNHGKRRKHGCDTKEALRYWNCRGIKANRSARRWYYGVWVEETQDKDTEFFIDGDDCLSSLLWRSDD